MVNDKIRGWFSMLKPWDGENASLSRIVWLNCRGMLLNTWCSDSFRRIGETWGDVLNVDDETMKGDSFQVGKVLICTENVALIDEWINIHVNGIHHKVRISKEECPDPLKTFDSSQLFRHLVYGADLTLVSTQNLQPNLQRDDDGNLGSVRSPVEANIGEEFGTELGVESPNVSAVREDDYSVDISITNDDAKWVSVVNDSVKESDCDDYLVGESKEEIDSFEDNAASRHLDLVGSNSNVFPIVDNTMEETNCLATFEDGKGNVEGSEHEGIQLCISLGSVEVLNYNDEGSSGAVENIGKGNWKPSRIEEKWGFLKSKKKGSRKQKKCVVFKSDIAAAALFASSDGINKIHLNAAQVARSISKIMDEVYLGDDDEIISNFSVTS